MGWSNEQFTTFLYTFLSYSMFHAARKTFPNIKSELHREWNLSTIFMGYCDSSFMITYAISLMLMGVQVDSLNPKRVLIFGLLSSSFTLLLFGLSHLLHYDNPFMLILLMMLMGVSQSTGWPSCIVLIGRFFKSSQGAIFGSWTSNQAVGNVFGTLLVALMLHVHMSIESIFMAPSALLLVISIFSYIYLKPLPEGETYPTQSTPRINPDNIDAAIHFDAENRTRNLLIRMESDIELTHTPSSISPHHRRHSSSMSMDTSHTPSSAYHDSLLTRSMPSLDLKHTHGHSHHSAPLPHVDGDDNDDENTTPLKHSPPGVITNGYHLNDVLLKQSADHEDNESQNDDVNIANGNGTYSDVNISKIQVLPSMELNESKTKLLPPTATTAHINDDPSKSLNDTDKVDALPISTSSSTLSAKLPFFQAITQKNVIPIACAHASVKMINYSWFMWLPFYLHSEIGLSSSHADVLSNLYDVGSIVGSVVAGYISDRLQKRIPIVVLLCFLSMASIMLFDTLVPKSSVDGSQQTSDTYLSLIMFLTGLFIGGPANLLPSTCISDLCNSSPELHASTGAIVGFIDGFGTIGGALGPSIVAYIFTHYGWSTVFVTLVIGLCCAVAALSNMCIKEVKEILNIYPHHATAHHHTNASAASTAAIDQPAMNGIA